MKMEKPFSDVDMPKQSENIVKLCEEDLIEKDLYNSLKSMKSYKSPCNGVLTNNFYGMFWNKLEEIFVDCVSEVKEREHLSTFQRQAVIKACVCYFLSNFYFSPNDSPSKTMKNVLYFI